MATITEEYVSFEVAKLLIEKGFSEPTLAYAYGQDMISYYSRPKVTDPLSIEAGRIPLPTQQMACKWLRKKYYIYADPIKQGNYNDCSEYYTWIVARMGIIHRNSTVTDKLSYEEACEAAIKYCLENLI